MSQKNTSKPKDNFTKYLVIGVVVAVLAIMVIPTVLSKTKPVSQAIPASVSSTDGYAISFNTDLKNVPVVDIYEDFQCPICQQFEVPNSSQLKSWVNTGAATVEIHPLSFLDGRATPNEYSSRAGNAAICVAEYAPNSFFDYNALLFEKQPAEGTAGPSNDDLVADLAAVQITATDKLTSCIKNKQFGPWLLDHTSKVLSSPIPGTNQTVDGTPYILVNGQRYTWASGEELMSPARFAQFVQKASAQQ